MFSKELLNKIADVTKQILFHSDKPVEFKSEKLKDSETEIKYSELAVGSEVSISSAAGDEVAPDGQYDTDSGVSFIVVEGKISEIVTNPEPEVKPEELAVEEPAKEAEAEKEEEPAKESELEQKIAELQDQLAALQAELEEEKSKESVSPSEFSTLKNDVLAIAELLSAIAKTPAEFSKTDERAEAQDSKNDRLRELAGIISKK
jgi:hypothetical protein